MVGLRLVGLVAGQFECQGIQSGKRGIIIDVCADFRQIILTKGDHLQKLVIPCIIRVRIQAFTVIQQRFSQGGGKKGGGCTPRGEFVVAIASDPTKRIILCPPHHKLCGIQIFFILCLVVQKNEGIHGIADTTVYHGTRWAKDATCHDFFVCVGKLQFD